LTGASNVYRGRIGQLVVNCWLSGMTELKEVRVIQIFGSS